MLRYLYQKIAEMVLHVTSYALMIKKVMKRTYTIHNTGTKRSLVKRTIQSWLSTVYTPNYASDNPFTAMIPPPLGCPPSQAIYEVADIVVVFYGMRDSRSKWSSSSNCRTFCDASSSFSDAWLSWFVPKFRKVGVDEIWLLMLNKQTIKLMFCY